MKRYAYRVGLIDYTLFLIAIVLLSTCLYLIDSAMLTRTMDTRDTDTSVVDCVQRHTTVTTFPIETQHTRIEITPDAQGIVACLHEHGLTLLPAE